MLRVLIVDDEAPARTRLRTLLGPLVREGRIGIVGEAPDGFEALSVLKEEAVDLLLVDIRMPGMSGFELIERLGPDPLPDVVFVTAHDDYAIRAFEAHALDYLLKPVSRARLLEAIERIERLRAPASPEQRPSARLERLMEWIEAEESSRTKAESSYDGALLEQLAVPYRDRTLILPVDQLVAAEVSEGLTRLVMLDETAGQPTAGKGKLTTYVVTYSLDQLEARLDPDRFMRVHRSALVAVPHIRELISWFSGRYKLRLTGGHEVIASRERSKLLKQRLTL